MTQSEVAQASDEEFAILNHREFKFVESYTYPDSPTLNNAKQSAIRAGYTHETANTFAHLWVIEDDRCTKPHVREAIKRRRESVARLAEVSREDVIRRLNAQSKGTARSVTKSTDDGTVYVHLGDLTEDEWYAIQEIEVSEYSEGRGEESRDIIKTKVKLADRKGATELLGKAMGLFAERRIHSNDPDNPMPGTPADFDLSRLTEDELLEFRRLQLKAMGK